MIGIYKISTNIDDRVYVGQSINIYSRFKQHKKKLEKGVHDSSKLQDFYNLHKDDIILEFTILEEVEDPDDLTRKEEKWVKTYNSMKNGFNMAKVGCISGDKKKPYIPNTTPQKREPNNNPNIKRLKKAFRNAGVEVYIKNYDDSLLNDIESVILEAQNGLKALLKDEVSRFKSHIGAIINKVDNIWGITILFINEFENNRKSAKYTFEYSTHNKIDYASLFDFFIHLDDIECAMVDAFKDEFRIHKNKNIFYRTEFPMYAYIAFYNPLTQIESV